MPSVRRIVDPLGLLPPAARFAAATGSAAADALGRTGLALLERVLRAPETAEVAERILRSAPAQRAVRVAIEDVAAELLDDPAMARLIERTLDSPRMTLLATRVLESEGMERLVAQVLDSPLVDASVTRVLASETLWLVVDEIARSPAVTDAISHQGAGFADQVAGEVGARTRRADARLERAARRLLHRRPPPDVGPLPAPQAR